LVYEIQLIHYRKITTDQIRNSALWALFG